MTRIDDEGCVGRYVRCGSKHGGKCKPVYRNWWLIKYNKYGTKGYAHLGKIEIPKSYVGKKVRFKVEVIE